MKLTSILIFFILFAFSSCDKEIVEPQINQTPTIKFLEPPNNLIILCDTILPIILEPNDSDGNIKKVDLFINNVKVKTFFNQPYHFNWDEAKIDNIGTFLFKAIVYDDKDSTGVDSININIVDGRIKYLGKYNFKIVKENWIMGTPSVYDTSHFSGVIRKYKLADSENDLFSDDDSGDDPSKKITINFKGSKKITSLISENGNLVSKWGFHYSHSGMFTHLDTIKFKIHGLGGIGGGVNYNILGIRE